MALGPDLRMRASLLDSVEMDDNRPEGCGTEDRMAKSMTRAVNAPTSVCRTNDAGSSASRNARRHKRAGSRVR